MDTTKIGLKGSPTRVKSTFTPKRQSCCEIFEIVDPRETAKVLFGKLAEAKLL